MTIYMDETGGMDTRLVGYGALIMHNPDQCKQIVENALQELSSDNSLNEESKKTIERGFFHASQDSSRAKEALLNEINKLESAKFVAFFMDVSQNEVEYGPYKKRKNYIKGLWNDSAFSNSLSFLNYIRDPVSVVMEKRDGLGDFPEDFVDKYKDLLEDCYRQPWNPLCFPKVEFILDDKKVYGLQICDFLLWTLSRVNQGEMYWSNRINWRVDSSIPLQGAHWGQEQRSFQGAIEESDHYYSLFDYDKNFCKHMDAQSIRSLFREIQEVVKIFSRKDALPPHAMHLNNEIKKIRYKMDADTQLTLIAELYLKLFDMIPLIDKDTAANEKPRLLYAKQMMGQLLLPRSDNSNIRLRNILLPMIE